MAVIFLVPAIRSGAQSWLTTGNSGTTPPGNFLGTIDNKPLPFRTNNIERIRLTSNGSFGIGMVSPLQKLDVKGNINIGKGFGLFTENNRVFFADSLQLNLFMGNGAGGVSNTGSGNTAGGYFALHSNTTGLSNTADGFDALYSNTTGGYNTANGATALLQNTTGSYNTASGYQSLYSNQDGSNNTATGYQSLYFNKASLLTATGYRALYSNTTGGFNTANGTFSMYNNTTGYSNSAYGYSSLQANTTGFNNVATGPLALFSNSTGSYNTATGYRALYTATTATENTAHGWEALYLTTTGRNNTAMGSSALYSNTTGTYNTAFGNYALFNTLTVTQNTAVGDIAGASFHNGNYNTFIGAQADATAADLFNSTALGRATYVSASNQVRVGSSSVTSIGGYTNWTNISDGRVKKNIKANVPGLAFINKLKPVTYNLDLDAAESIMQLAGRERIAGKSATEPSATDIASRNAKQQTVYTGFVAQEVEKAAKELNFDFSGVDAAKNDKDLYGLRYAEFVVPLVKAVQELSQQNDDMKEMIRLQQKEIAQLKDMMSQSVTTSTRQDAVTNNSAKASLEQNIPNPFNQSATIRYTLPQAYNTARIIVTDKQGKALKELNITGVGKGSIQLDAATLPAGTYQYTLYVDGSVADTRQMVISR